MRLWRRASSRSRWGARQGRAGWAGLGWIGLDGASSSAGRLRCPALMFECAAMLRGWLLDSNGLGWAVLLSWAALLGTLCGHTLQVPSAPSGCTMAPSLEPFLPAACCLLLLQGDGELGLKPDQQDEWGLLQGGWRNRVCVPLMQAAAIPVIQSWNETVPMWEAHRDNGAGHECSHYCHPSAPQASAGSSSSMAPCLALGAPCGACRGR